MGNKPGMQAQHHASGNGSRCLVQAGWLIQQQNNHQGRYIQIPAAWHHHCRACCSSFPMSAMLHAMQPTSVVWTSKDSSHLIGSYDARGHRCVKVAEVDNNGVQATAQDANGFDDAPVSVGEVSA
jgi:hypothetical protein